MERLQKQNGNLWIICHFVLSLKVKVKDSMMTIVNIVLNAGNLLRDFRCSHHTHTDGTGVVRVITLATQWHMSLVIAAGVCRSFEGCWGPQEPLQVQRLGTKTAGSGGQSQWCTRIWLLGTRGRCLAGGGRSQLQTHTRWWEPGKQQRLRPTADVLEALVAPAVGVHCCGCWVWSLVHSGRAWCQESTWGYVDSCGSELQVSSVV